MRYYLPFVTLAVVGCFRAPPPRYPEADRLVGAVADRLALMDDVARAKWNTKAAVSDPPREQALIAESTAVGRGAGLDPKDVAAVVAAQIEAAKLVQQARFDVWKEKKQGPFPDAPDLARDLRPKVDKASRELVAALAAYRAAPPTPAWAVRRVADERIADPEVRAVALKPLMEDDKVTR